MEGKSRTHGNPTRTLVILGLIVALLFGLMALLATWKPRLGLDLRGGTTVTLTARESMTGKVTTESMEQARTIIQQRVDGLGVGESAVTIQGADQIQVAVPNIVGSDLVDLVGKTAQLGFRNVFYVIAAEPAPSPEPSVAPSADASASTEPSPSAAASTAAGRVAPRMPTAPPTPRPSAPSGTSKTFEEKLAWTPTEQDLNDFIAWQCGDPFPDLEDQVLFACDTAKSAKYLLGPVLISGQRVTDAQAGIPQGELNYVVTLDFDAEGASNFGAATTFLSSQAEPQNQFAIVLDGEVTSAPRVTTPILNGSAEISGGDMTQQSTTELANQLRYGALPLSFDVSSVDTVSPSLGGEQLRAGIIAGLIGLALVVLYNFFYYRGLGILVVASLVVAALINWAVIVLLGETVGFALNLPGIAGLVVGIGITADSFVVYYEQIRDEVRDGHSLSHAVESGWQRARGTILIADGVQLLSAVVLFALALGAVKGFAFTQLITTLIDLVIVFMFTKPVATLLVRHTKFFGEGRRFSGFEADHLGVSPQTLLGRRRSIKGRVRDVVAPNKTQLQEG